MHIRRAIVPALLVAGLVQAAPAAAHDGAGPGGERRAGDRAGLGGDVPSRVSSRIRRANRALERASDAVDDENATGAASALKSVRRNLAAALKAAKRRTGSDDGPDSLWAVAAADHRTIAEVTSLFDEASGSTVDGLAATLDAAIAGRDDAVAAIAALSDKGDYAYVLQEIADDLGAEIDSIDEALADDTLTSEAQAALTAARAKLVTAQGTVAGLVSGLGALEQTAGSEGRNGDCPERSGDTEGSGSRNGARV